MKGGIFMPTRLTWEQIKQQYPDQWLGLTDVERSNASTVKSAVVAYPNLTKNQALKLAFDSNGKIVARTTKDGGLSIGVVSL